MTEKTKEKVVKIEFTDRNFVHASYNDELVKFLDEVQPNTASAPDVRIFSTYFQEQWPYRQRYLGYKVYEIDG